MECRHCRVGPFLSREERQMRHGVTTKVSPLNPNLAQQKTRHGYNVNTGQDMCLSRCFMALFAHIVQVQLLVLLVGLWIEMEGSYAHQCTLPHAEEWS